MAQDDCVHGIYTPQGSTDVDIDMLCASLENDFDTCWLLRNHVVVPMATKNLKIGQHISMHMLHRRPKATTEKLDSLAASTPFIRATVNSLYGISEQLEELLVSIHQGNNARAREIIRQKGYLVHCSSATCGTALHLAISEGCPLDLILKLINAGVDVNACEYASGSPSWVNRVYKMFKYLSPLEYAALYNHASIFDMLRSYGAVICNPQYLLRLMAEIGSIEMFKKLVAMGLTAAETRNPPRRSDSKWKYPDSRDIPLHIAVKASRDDMVSALLAAGANVNSLGMRGERVTSALSIACRKKYHTIAKLLIGGHADPNIGQELPLYYAVLSGTHDIISLLIDTGAIVNDRPPVMLGYIHLAASMGRADIVELLIKGGANVNTKCDRDAMTIRDCSSMRGYTPLGVAISHGHLNIANMLLDAGARINVHMDTGQSILTLAVLYGNVSFVFMLIHNYRPVCVDMPDIDPDKKYSNPRKYVETVGATPLFHAIRGNQDVMPHDDVSSMVLVLLNAGADVNYKIPRTGECPLYAAADCGSIDAAREILLSNSTVTIDAPCLDMGETPLLCAMRHGYTDMCDLLVRHGADVTMAFNTAITTGRLLMADVLVPFVGHPSRFSHMPSQLWAAAEHGHFNLVKHCVRRGDDINAYNPTTRATPLNYAVQNGHLAIAEYLLELPGILVDRGRIDPCFTPLHLAIQKQHVKMVSLLFLHGANPLKKTPRGSTAYDLLDKYFPCGGYISTGFCRHVVDTPSLTAALSLS